jgi:predicted 3-demethylubiquinone-9 3-methyltransferase (glyoxalase superfamily)
MQKITTFLWFDNQAEEAANHYVSIFKTGKVLHVSRANGKALIVTFELEGQKFMALNGGPIFKLTEAISLHVDCEGQAEVDELWQKLSAGGSEGRCGWLKDKYGLSWQIIPSALPKLLSDLDPAKAKVAFEAMMKMSKIVVADLTKAQ